MSGVALFNRVVPLDTEGWGRVEGVAGSPVREASEDAAACDSPIAMSHFKLVLDRAVSVVC